MPRRPRRLQFPLREVVTVHCPTRCVRRYALLGRDPVTGADRSHRRAWLVRRLYELAEVFAIDLDDFMILENHLHLLLTLRWDLAAAWELEEIVDRWLGVAGRSLDDEGRAARRKWLLDRPEEVESLRLRLCHPADFHKLLKQPLAVMANREDGVSGPFWAGRYGCFPARDLAHVLAAAQYVDLNQVRAGMVESPEESTCSGIRARTLVMRQAMQNLEDDRRRRSAARRNPKRKRNRAQERRSRRDAEARRRLRDEVAEHIHGRPEDLRHPEDGLRITPIEPRGGRRGLIPGMTLRDYLQLLDRNGRRHDPRKRGAIPARLARILDRLGVDEGRLMVALRRRGDLRGSVHGGPAACREEAARLGRRSIRPAIDVALRSSRSAEPGRGGGGPFRGREHGFGSDAPFD